VIISDLTSTVRNTASGDMVIMMDRYGQYSPSEKCNLLQLVPHYEIDISMRTAGYLGGWFRDRVNRFYYRYTCWLSSHEIKDLTSRYRAKCRSVAVFFYHHSQAVNQCQRRQDWYLLSQVTSLDPCPFMYVNEILVIIEFDALRMVAVTL
jgi:hypothetical protein